uniref:Angiotensin-converting enzyme n=2 Tax=Timema TaxID=61471 RepID=A0A7R8VEJ3_TIMDO|nr:unnamed protein product [Timema douglasi]
MIVTVPNKTMTRTGWFLLLTLVTMTSTFDPEQEDLVSDEEQRARNYLAYIDKEFSRRATDSVNASWAYASNITDENLAKKIKLPYNNDPVHLKLEVSADNARYQKQQWTETIKFRWQSFRDDDLRRQFKKYSVLGTAALSEKKHEKLEKLVSEMQSIYSKAKICDYKTPNKCDLNLEPELIELLRTSRDPAELKHAWVEWRKESGEKCRSLFEHYVALSNEAAILNTGPKKRRATMLNCIYRDPCLCDVDFTDTTEYWLMDYESPDFQKQVVRLWEQIEPLYKELHAYVRRKLRETYGEEIVSRNGPIPAHLLGNMWAQKWGNVLELTVPYPNASAVDVTPRMKEQTWGNVLDISTPYPEKEAVDVTPQMVKKGYTPLRMFKLAEEFFISLNLSAMPASFWDNSILEKPKDRDLVCHASAWDFYDGKDFRIKQCTRVDMEDLLTAHHEMGHVQYFIQYKDQPSVYKEGANPGRCTRVDMNDLLTAHHEMGHIQYYIQYKHLPKVYKRGANPGFHEAVGDVMSLSVSTPKHLRKVGLLDANSMDDYEATINYLYLQGLQKVAFLPSALLMDLWRWDVFKGHTTSDRYNCDWWKLREKYQGVEPPTHRTEDNFDPGAKYHIIASVPYIRYFVSYVIQFQFHRSLCEKAGQFDPEDPESKPLHECDIYQSTEAGNLLGHLIMIMHYMNGKSCDDDQALYGYDTSMTSRALNLCVCYVSRCFSRMLQMGSSRPWPDAMEVVTGQREMDASGLLDYFSPLYKWLQDENNRTEEYIGWEPSNKDLTKILENSRDPEELKHVWLKWRDATGRRMKDMFVQYVELENESARLNSEKEPSATVREKSQKTTKIRKYTLVILTKAVPRTFLHLVTDFPSAVDYWLQPYEEPNFRSHLEDLWAKIRPLYVQLHAYVRRKLREVYGEGYTPKRMFKEADDFFKSINLTAVPRLFWKKSVFEKANRSEEMVCHPNAWDMFDLFFLLNRIKMCARVNMENFFTSHHEMGHIQYYLQYKDQPFVFRNGANPGFHEAVGDVVALSVMSRDHLRHLHLLRGAIHPSPEVEINFLYEMALQKIAFLPFGYLVDAWRWDVFAGKVGPEAYNRHWWYMRYFVSYIIQFQFHRALCQEAEIFDPNKRRLKPLHQCDIYNHTRAGNLLGRMLQMGSSRPWPDAMEVLTGQREMDASGLLDYFKPLSDWLKRENIRTNEPLDWLKSKCGTR